MRNGKGALYLCSIGRFCNRFTDVVASTVAYIRCEISASGIALAVWLVNNIVMVLPRLPAMLMGSVSPLIASCLSHFESFAIRPTKVYSRIFTKSIASDTFLSFCLYLLLNGKKVGCKLTTYATNFVEKLHLVIKTLNV